MSDGDGAALLLNEGGRKGKPMPKAATKAWDTSEEDALCLWLRDAVRSGAYTEEYCTKLEAYDKMTKNKAAVFFFAARLAFALGETAEAHRLAHEAYARRKLSHKIWQLLFEIGDALGLDEEAIFFKALCQKNMEIEVSVPRFSDRRWQEAFFRGMLNVHAVPFRLDFATEADGSPTLLLQPALGQFLLSEDDEAASYRYYCAVYNAWDCFHTQANRFAFMKCGGARTIEDYSGMVFDVVKARRMEGAVEIEDACILMRLEGFLQLAREHAASFHEKWEEDCGC